jgi:hypothetical protein
LGTGSDGDEELRDGRAIQLGIFQPLIDANEGGFFDKTPDSVLKIRVNWRSFAVNVTPGDRAYSVA